MFALINCCISTNTISHAESRFSLVITECLYSALFIDHATCISIALTSHASSAVAYFTHSKLVSLVHTYAWEVRAILMQVA